MLPVLQKLQYRRKRLHSRQPIERRRDLNLREPLAGEPAQLFGDLFGLAGQRLLLHLQRDRTEIGVLPGWAIVERPLIRADETMRLEEHMNLAVHPGYEMPSLFAVICDNYLVEADGPSACLHRTPKQIFEL